MLKLPKTVAITQSNYLPWRGYFDLIGSADELILLDSVQYTRRDWRNRNLIKTPTGLSWLTIPVDVKGKYLQSIDETRVSDPGWARSHMRSIELNYKQAPYFDEVSTWLFTELAAVEAEGLLTNINQHLVSAICRKLQIKAPIRHCCELLDRARLAEVEASERVIQLCRAAGATRYLSGPAARSYLDSARFANFDIEVVWMDYAGYPDYPQLWGAFEAKVSVVDLLLNTGPEAPEFLNCHRARS